MKKSPLFILPNLFTAASIYLGILSIMYASKGEFAISCWLVIIAMVFDGLDGRVARMTNTTSKFGIEFDSLADIVSFGVAPALILYFYQGENLGKYGVVVSALFVVFGAIRLARFNISTNSSEPNIFIGLPIPVAAIFVVSWILVIDKYSFPIEFIYVFVVLVFTISLLMVSNIRYPSFKKFSINPKNRKKIFIGLITILAGIYLFPREIITIFVTIYILFGPLRAIYYMFSKRYNVE